LNDVDVSAIHEFLTRTHDATSGRPCLAERGFESITDLLAKARVMPGSLILVSLPNSVGLLHAFFGIYSAGCVPALLPALLPPKRLLQLARALSAHGLLEMRSNKRRTGSSRFVCIGRLQLSIWEGESSPSTYPGEVVMMTSGTSGVASACVFDLRQLLLNALRHAKAIGQRSTDNVLVTLPLCFSFALVAQALATWVSGGHIFVDGPPFSPSSYFSTIRRNEISVSSLTPLLARRLLCLDTFATVAWPRVLTVGGDAVTEECARALLERAPSTELYITYGLTQAGPRVATLAAHAVSGAQLASLGAPLEGTQLSLGRACPDRDGSELLVASETLMKRRIGEVEGRTPDWASPGVLATGDIFVRDNGCLYYRGRLSDYTIIAGEKVSLSSIRRLACDVHGVTSAETNVIRDSNGIVSGYELLVATATHGEIELASIVERKINDVLRPSERPRRIRLLNSESGTAYK
jgi:long-chain acyl-CoA synthetase